MIDFTPYINTIKAMQDQNVLGQLEEASKLFNNMEVVLKTIDKIATASQLRSQVEITSKLINQIPTAAIQLDKSIALPSLKDQIKLIQSTSIPIDEINNTFKTISSQIDLISNIAKIYENIEVIPNLISRLNVTSENDLLRALSGVEQQDYEQKLRESFEEIETEQDLDHDLLADIATNQVKRLSELIFKLFVLYSVFQQVFGLPTLPELLNEISTEAETKNDIDPQPKSKNCLVCASQKADTNDGNHPTNDNHSSNDRTNAETIVISSALRLRKCNKETDNP